MKLEDWCYFNFWLTTNQDSVVLTKKYTNTEKEQNRGPRNKCHKYSQLNLGKGAKAIKWNNVSSIKSDETIGYPLDFFIFCLFLDIHLKRQMWIQILHLSYKLTQNGLLT